MADLHIRRFSTTGRVFVVLPESPAGLDWLVEKGWPTIAATADGLADWALFDGLTVDVSVSPDQVLEEGDDTRGAVPPA